MRATIAMAGLLLLVCVGCARESLPRRGPRGLAIPPAMQDRSQGTHKPDCLCDQCLITRWRSEKLSLQEAERQLKLAECHPSFRAEWRAFASRLRPGNELWSFSSPGPTWEALAGKQGYAIFDGKRLVAHIITMEN